MTEFLNEMKSRKARTMANKRVRVESKQCVFLNVPCTLFYCLPMVALLETRDYNEEIGERSSIGHDEMSRLLAIQITAKGLFAS